ncbi:MAG: LysR family transcriptional regulator [Burkholderiaceae bacterium]|nr:LysR family transcriptional regulator [Burkholderiaceae bacterium]
MALTRSMEARQLAYFVAACQWPNHAIAARELGVSSSALSASLNRFARELGVDLFRRGPTGSYPTADARVLYQEFEQILQLLEMAPGHVADPDNGELAPIRVHSPLHFSIGTIRKAASFAIRATWRDFPNALFEFALANHRWHSDDSPPAAASSPGLLDSHGDHYVDHVDLDYFLDHDGTRDVPGAIPVFDDPWVCITNLDDEHLRSGRSIALARLRAMPLTLPAMRPRLLDQIDRYIEGLGLRPVPRSAVDPGDIPEFCAGGESFCLLLPRSMVSQRIDPAQARIYELSDRLSARLVASVHRRHPAALAFVERLAQALKGPESSQVYFPEITFKQLRYFRALFQHRKVGLAARKLNVAQPALSSQLGKLERTLGVQLFDRTPTGIEARAQARRFARLARAVFALLDAVAPASPRDRSTLQTVSIGVSLEVSGSEPIATALAATLLEWDRRPDSPKARVVDVPDSTATERLANGSLDFVIGYCAGDATGCVERLRLADPEALVLTSDPVHALAAPGDVALARLGSLALALTGPGTSIRQAIDAAAAIARVRIEPRFEIDSMAALQAILRAGAIATVLPRSVARSWCANGPLLCNPIVDPVLERALSIEYDARRGLREQASVFVGMLRRHLAAAR